MISFWQDGDPVQVQAVCTHTMAAQLMPYDHHRVIVDSRWGILLTYHWPLHYRSEDSLWVKVIFHPAPEHNLSISQLRKIIRQHPVCPPEIQILVNNLIFERT